jgi:hypothetical protein
VVLVVDEVEDAGNVAATVGMVGWILINCIFAISLMLPYLRSPAHYLFESYFIFFDGKTLANIAQYCPIVHTLIFSL